MKRGVSKSIIVIANFIMSMAPEDVAVWREGDIVVVRRDRPLPPRPHLS
jgi:hypothetical protein